jgi:hypothetical protein
MMTERDLLIDIIQNAPEQSVWNISSDSWERIPVLFSPYILLDNIYGWDITINQDNREQLIDIIDKEELYDKIVHQDIILNGNVIFKSYDYMSGSYLKRSFPCYDDIMQKYHGEEIELLELKPI